MKKDILISHVLEVSKKFSSIQKVILFGSHAKRNSSKTSDYDLAFEWIDSPNQSWGIFTEQLREKNPTLFSLDLVRLDLCGQELAKIIKSEGIVIYEKTRVKI